MDEIDATQPKVLLAGDTHGFIQHIRYLLDIAEREGCAHVFQLGDFGYWPHTGDGRAFLRDVEKFAGKVGRIIYWLDGNHDKSSLIDHSEKDGHGFVLVSEHVRYAPRGHRWTWAGTRFIALGGAYSVDKSWRLEQEAARNQRYAAETALYGKRPRSADELLWFPEEELTDAELAQALANPELVDVMLTHDKPRASDPRWNRKNMPECLPNQDRIQAAVDALRPRLLVHGHLHFPYRDQIRAGGKGWTTVVGLDCDAEAAQNWDYDKKDSWTVLSLEAAGRTSNCGELDRG